MGKKTFSQAKNDIRSCLIEIIDPSPTKADKTRLWDYFEDGCAYCGKKLDRKSRKAHVDHLIPKDRGFNHISNRVLACDVCNGDQKRDSYWRQFIATKGTPEEQAARIARIERWIAETGRPGPDDIETAALRELAKKLSDRVCGELEKQVHFLRKQNKKKSPGSKKAR